MENKNEQIQEKQAAVPMEAEAARSGKLYVPLVDIYETKDGFVLTADVPGVDEKSMDITIEKNVLTISGAVDQRPCKDHELSLMEYDVGDYRRSFILSADIDRDKIEATVKDGVLHLTLPKTEAVKIKKITIH